MVCPISVNFTGELYLGRDDVCALTKLRNEIYVLSRASLYSVLRDISAFDDQYPFRCQMKIRIKEIESPIDIESPADIVASEKNNCVYVSDSAKNCVWKITDDQHNIIKWLTTIHTPHTLSVSSDGQLLLVSRRSSSLMIYGSDAELIRYIQLSTDIDQLTHAVETSLGNFIILHQLMEKEDRWGSVGLRKRTRVMKWVVSELSADGQTVIRRFIPSNEEQTLSDPPCLSLGCDDQVFVSDSGEFSERGRGRVIVLDSDLKWNRILCSTRGGRDGIPYPNSLCYDEEKRQLIVGGSGPYSGTRVYIYTLSNK